MTKPDLGVLSDYNVVLLLGHNEAFVRFERTAIRDAQRLDVLSRLARALSLLLLPFDCSNLLAEHSLEALHAGKVWEEL
jgi:hypothetical protein